MVGDDEDYNINNWYSSQQSDPGSERYNRNGHSGKDRMAYGGLAYYDNPLYTGPCNVFRNDNNTIYHFKQKYTTLIVVIMVFNTLKTNLS
jgi:hypothetical protein